MRKLLTATSDTIPCPMSDGQALFSWHTTPISYGFEIVDLEGSDCKDVTTTVMTLYRLALRQ